MNDMPSESHYWNKRKSEEINRDKGGKSLRLCIGIGWIHLNVKIDLKNLIQCAKNCLITIHSNNWRRKDTVGSCLKLSSWNWNVSSYWSGTMTCAQKQQETWNKCYRNPHARCREEVNMGSRMGEEEILGSDDEFGEAVSGKQHICILGVR